MSPRSIALFCAAAAIAVSGTAAAAVAIERGSVTALVHMSAAEPMAELARRTDPSFAFVDVQSHYDGVYFYAMARDPFARDTEHRLIDRSAYRYGHVGYAWIVRVASLGRASAIPAALLIVGLIASGIGAFAVSVLARDLGASGWWGLLVAFSPGLIYAVSADTSEPVAVALTALGLLAWIRRRWVAAGVALTAACLTKEPCLLVPMGLGIWQIVEWFRTRDFSDVVPRVIALGVGPVLFVAWYFYLHSTFGVWPFVQETKDYFALPFVGWWRSMRQAAGMAAQSYYVNQVGNASLPLLVTFAAALALGIFRSFLMRNPLQPVFLLTALLILSLNAKGVLFPKDLLRESAIVMLLLPAAVGASRLRERGVPD